MRFGGSLPAIEIDPHFFDMNYTTKSLSRKISGSRKSRRGFTLPELLVAMTVLSVLLLLLSELLNQVQRTWTFSENRISQFREARVGFDLITKNMSQAALNTYWEADRDDENGGQVQRYKRHSELHFVTDQAQEMDLDVDGKVFTHGLFFQAPLGFSEKYRNLSALYNARGYYVVFGHDERYKPTFVNAERKYRFRLMEYRPPAEENQVYNDGDEERYASPAKDVVYDQWYNYQSDQFTHPLADNIVALVVSPRQSIADAGAAASNASDEIAPDYKFDSNEAPEKFRQQVPPLVHLTMVAIDESSAVRYENNDTVPEQIASVIAGKFRSVSSYESDIAAMEEAFRASKINYRVFSSMVAIRSSKWSTLDPAAIGF